MKQNNTKNTLITKNKQSIKLPSISPISLLKTCQSFHNFPQLPKISSDSFCTMIPPFVYPSENDRTLPIASLTKIMTLYVAFKLSIRLGVDIQKTNVEISEKASTIKGTSAQLRKGQKYSILDLLYGLMLPSGNDAAIAIAQYFGHQLFKIDNRQENNYVKIFVDQMNMYSKKFGLNNTYFSNPHGMDNFRNINISTAQQICVLTYIAMGQRLIRQIVSKKNHKYYCQIGQKGREYLWKNTNKMLDQKYYEGVKTGTTSIAGRCLAAYYKNGEKKIFVIVLGAKSNKLRYDDTRSLTNWAIEHYQILRH